MKYFIFSISLFLAILFSAVSIVWFSVTRADFKIPTEKTKLVLGASGVECALNDSLIHSIFNLSESGDNYLCSFVKLKKIKSENPHINTLILGFSSLSLSSRLDKWYDIDYGDKIGTLGFVDFRELSSFYGVFGVIEKLLSPRGFRTALNYLIKDAVIQYQIGGYLFLVRDKLEESLLRRKSGSPSSWKFSTLQIKYLQKIIEYCHTNGIQVILFNAPVYINSESSRSRQLEYVRKIKGISFWDYSDFRLPDSCYGDIRHLNYRGARIFSEYIDGVIDSVCAASDQFGPFDLNK